MPDEPKPPRKRAPRKRPSTAANNVTPTAAERAKAAEQIASVTPINRAPKTSGRNGTNGTGRGPTSPLGLRVQQRRVDAMMLRRMGLTYPQVITALRERHGDQIPEGYDPRECLRDVQSQLDTVNVESAQGVLEEDLATLLAMQRRFFAQALNGDARAGSIMLRILERRSKYLGLDSPIKHTLTGADGGPIHFSTEEPGEIHDALMAGLDALLPHAEQPQLPGVASATE